MDYDWICINALLVAIVIVGFVFTGDMLVGALLLPAYWSFHDAMENGL